MDESSPYAVLGVPQWAVDDAIGLNDGKDLLKIAEAQFRSLSRILHPDMGGDSDRFVELVDAFSEIRSDPLMVARYYTSHRDMEARRRRNQMVHASRFSAEERNIITRLLRNVDPTKVAPWLREHEALLGNLAFDSPMSSSLLVVLNHAKHSMVASLAKSEYDGRKFVYSRSRQRWLVSINMTNGRAQPLITVRNEKVNVIGGISEDEALQTSSKATQESNLVALPTAIGTASLSWTLASNCEWLGKIKPSANKDDYLVVMKAEPSAAKPLISIVGPVYRTRRLV